MSKDFPEFRRSVGVSPVEQPLGGGGFAELANTLSNFTNRVAKQRLQILEAQDKPLAEAAGSQPGFRPSAGLTERQRAFNQVALAANKMTTEVNIKNGINTLKNQILMNPNADASDMASFHQGVANLSQKLMEQTPEENKPVAQNFINYFATNAQNQIADHVHNISMQRIKAQTMQDIQSLQNSSYNASSQGDTASAAALMGQANQFTQAGVATGVIDPKLGELNTQDALEKNVQNAYIGDFQRSLEEGKADEYIDKFANTDVDLPPQKALSTQVEMTGMATNHVNNTLIEGQNLVQNFEDQLVKIQNGEDARINPIIAKAAQLGPEFEQTARIEAQKAELINSTRRALMFATPSQRTEALQKLSAIDIPGIDTQKMLSTAAQINKNQLKLLQENPANYALQDPSVKQAFIDFRNGTNDDPYQTLLNKERQLGVPEGSLAIIDSDKASLIAHQYNSIQNPEDQLNFMANTLGFNLQNPTQSKLVYGQYTPIVMQQLQKAHVPAMQMHVFQMAMNPQSAPFVADMINTLSYGKDAKGNPEQAAFKKLKGAIDDTTFVSSVQKEINNQSQNYFNTIGRFTKPPIGQIATLRQTMTNLALYLHLHKNQDATSAADNAYKAIIGNFVNTDHDINGHTVAIPSSLDPDLRTPIFHQLIKNANDNVLNINVPQRFISQSRTSNPNISDDAIRESYLQSILDNGYITLAPDQKSLQLIDGNDIPVSFKGKQNNREGIQVDLDRLNNLQDPFTQAVINNAQTVRLDEPFRRLPGRTTAASILGIDRPSGEISAAQKKIEQERAKKLVVDGLKKRAQDIDKNLGQAN